MSSIIKGETIVEKEGGPTLTYADMQELIRKEVSKLYYKYKAIHVDYDIEDIVRRKWNIDKKVIYLYDWAKNHVGFKMDTKAGINPLAIRWMDKAIFNFISPYSDQQPVG